MKKKVYQVKIRDGVWVNCYKSTGENVGNQYYKTKKDAKAGHEEIVRLDRMYNVTEIEALP